MSIQDVVAFHTGLDYLRDTMKQGQDYKAKRLQIEKDQEALDTQKEMDQLKIKDAQTRGELTDFATKRYLGKMNEMYGNKEKMLDLTAHATDMSAQELQDKQKQAMGNVQELSQSPDVHAHIGGLLSSMNQPEGSMAGSNIPAPDKQYPEMGSDLSIITGKPQTQGYNNALYGKPAKSPKESHTPYALIGDLESGQVQSNNTQGTIDRDTAEKYFMSKYGSDWQKFPQLVNYLNDKFPQGGEQQSPQAQPAQAAPAANQANSQETQAPIMGKPAKSTQVSAITGIDVSKIPSIKTPEERDQALGQLPSDIAENVKMAGEYRIDPHQLFGLRNNSGDRARFDALVSKMYPGWDTKKYSQQKMFMTDLAKGLLSKKTDALNTLAHHIDTIDKTVDALGPGGYQPTNFVINLAKQMTGDSTITDYNFAREAVNNEFESLLSQVGATQAGVERVHSILSKNSSYSQMKGNLKVMSELIEGRAQPLRQRFKNIMGRDEAGEILYPESEQVFKKFEDMKMNNGKYVPASTGNKKSYSHLW